MAKTPRITRKFKNVPKILTRPGKRIPTTASKLPTNTSTTTKQGRQVKQAKTVKYNNQQSNIGSSILPTAHADKDVAGEVMVEPDFIRDDKLILDQAVGHTFGDMFPQPFGNSGLVGPPPVIRTKKINKPTKQNYPKPTASSIPEQSNPFGLFAQGVGNEVHNLFGFAGVKPGEKSILSKATDQALAGDWGSAGNTIANNPYKFAGNVVGGGGIGVLGGAGAVIGANIGNAFYSKKTANATETEKRYPSRGELKEEAYAQKAKEAKEKEDRKDSLFGGYGQFL